MIPGIVNTFIGLFKDTTLVAIVGIFDLISTIEASRIDPNWAAPTITTTGYAFAALFYFVFCFGMSRYSIGGRAAARRPDTSGDDLMATTTHIATTAALGRRPRSRDPKAKPPFR